MDASSSVVVITDRSGLITYVNPKFTEVTGYRADEVLGQNPRILKSGEMPPDTYREMWDTVAAGREWRGEFFNRRKDGSSYWESASISAVHDEAGEITHFVAVKEDITARKLAEQALVESEEKYRLLFSRQFDAAALVDDREGRFVEVNDAFLRLFGWSRQELGDMQVEALWVDGNPSVSPPGGHHSGAAGADAGTARTFAVELAAGSFSWHGRSVTCLILRDITERIESQRLLEELSVTDGLTGLANRRAFDDQLEKEWRRAVRTRAAVALIMADLDHFKDFNDTCGHLEGDECLRKVAAVLARATRRVDRPVGPLRRRGVRGAALRHHLGGRGDAGGGAAGQRRVSGHRASRGRVSRRGDVEPWRLDGVPPRGGRPARPDPGGRRGALQGQTEGTQSGGDRPRSTG